MDAIQLVVGNGATEDGAARLIAVLTIVVAANCDSIAVDRGYLKTRAGISLG